MTSPAASTSDDPTGADGVTPSFSKRNALNEQRPAWRHRLRQWFYSRLPRTDTLTLTQRNVYILPTRAGWMLAFTLLLLLVGSINYQLNLGYLLTFLLTGAALVGMHVCHGNLRGLSLQMAAPAPVHAGQAIALDIHLHNPGARVRWGIGLGVLATPPVADVALVWTDVPAQGLATAQVAWATAQRGRHTLPALTAVTLFPLGTFRVWTVWRPAVQALVYPAPEPRPPPLPQGEPLPDPGGGARVQAADEFEGVRAYRRGDAQRQVVWKRAAQSFSAGRDDLVSRDSVSQRRRPIWLDVDRCGVGGLEARLSRLTAWVLMAEPLGLDYGLRLPGTDIAPDHGPAHRARCLEALALC
jgi:uncharacterized protein (DUF58 family)